MDVIINQDSQNTPEEVKPLASHGSALLNLLACLNYDPSNPPLGELLKRYHQLEGEWLVLNPAHWQASHNNVAIVAFGEDLELEEAELKILFHSFSDFLREAGMGLYYHDAYTWLISTTHKSLLKTKPIHQMLNKPLFYELAQMDETMYWQKFFTESQMFFSSKHNQSVVNGVWFWGGGHLAKEKQINITADQEWFRTAQLCSTTVSLYEPTCSLNDCDLLLLRDISVLNNTQQEQLKNREVSWYWNNCAYAYSPASWFTRLWRTLVHAHKTTPHTKS